jgi:hypothetical protein
MSGLDDDSVSVWQDDVRGIGAYTSQGTRAVWNSSVIRLRPFDTALLDSDMYEKNRRGLQLMFLYVKNACKLGAGTIRLGHTEKCADQPASIVKVKRGWGKHFSEDQTSPEHLLG